MRARRRILYRREERNPEINLAPMIDCVFILLIFFIVTTVFVEKPTVDDLLKPVVRNDRPLEKRSIIFAVTKDNTIVYGNDELSLASAGSQTRQLLSREPFPVIIQGDVRAESGLVSRLYSELKNAGAERIFVSTQNR